MLSAKKLPLEVDDFLQEGILRTLAYFDIFHYPLTRDEIRQFLGMRVDERSFDLWLSRLEAGNRIYFYKGFYSIQHNPLLAFRRMQGNARAMVLLARAHRIGRFLYQFPFVRAIAISGSLSKNFADDKADIDFFIIAKKGRLWISRTIMHLYKKLTFFRGHQHFYCMNYYIDEQAYQLSEQNLFTATELKTLLPVCGQPAMKAFFMANTWANHWLPACPFREQERKDPKPNSWKRTMEWLLKGKVGSTMENFLYRVTTKRWDRKSIKEKRNHKGARMALITGLHFAKSNPGEFQEKVTALYKEKLRFLREAARS